MERDGEEVPFVVKAIVEVLGKPQDHVQKSLELVITNVSQRKGIDILESHIEKPTALKDTLPGYEDIEGMFSGFVELEMEFDTLDMITGFCLDFWPSSIDILEPEILDIHASELSRHFNDIVNIFTTSSKTTKALAAQKNILQANSEALLRNLVVVSLSKEEYDLETLSGIVGIKGLKLAPLLTRFMDEGFITQKDDGKYALVKKNG